VGERHWCGTRGGWAQLANKGAAMTVERQYPDHSLTFRVDDHRTAWREVDGEGVVLDLANSVYFGLNRSAGVLWPRLIQGANLQQLTELLLSSVPPPPTRSQAEQQISQFLDALDSENLLYVDVVE
jgi:hypothetical protein